MRLLTLSAALVGLVAAAPPSLPGPDDGGWDYARVDPEAGMLYVTRATSVSAFDLTGKTPPRSIGKIAHGHAVLPIAGTPCSSPAAATTACASSTVATGRNAPGSRWGATPTPPRSIPRRTARS